MGITMKEYGEKLWDDRIYITEGEDISNLKIATSPRINISYAEEAALFPWRFCIEGNKYVSKARLL
jgi:DNA-3-methyladenine glycosylase